MAVMGLEGHNDITPYIYKAVIYFGKVWVWHEFCFGRLKPYRNNPKSMIVWHDQTLVRVTKLWSVTNPWTCHNPDMSNPW